ncbi:MAG TPA: FAD-dependent oxidoreductase [Candidatus Dormibacteraeota bacterium]|nr:FAD-dependent oxidoreductase [Candidatus Dormibacteraeota bacterium]
MSAKRVVIVGASTAGRSAAVALREGGHDGEVILLGEEPDPPYDRPQLSKEYLRGAVALDDVIRPLRLWPEHAIETRLGVRARRVLPEESAVELDGGERVGYDALVLATGVRNRRLQVPGAGLEGVLDLRDVAGSDRIRAAAGPGRRAVVVGMGFIGCEVAAALRHLGAEVTAVEPLAVPLERSVGETVGRVVEGLHRDHGVDLRLGEGVTAFEGDGRVERVVTRGGGAIECDLVVVGVGVEPAVETVAGTAIEVGDGIVVDERCRTGIPGILAAGDVARHLHPVAGRHLRVEHWQNAVQQGKVAASTILGGDAVHDEIPWFWSDQYDCNIQYAGFAEPWDRLVVRGSLEDRSFTAFQLRDGRVVAAVAVNQGRDLRRTVPLIRSGAVVDPERLADPEVDLRTLLSETASGPPHA